MKQLIYHPLVYTFFTIFVLVLCSSLYLNSREIRQSRQGIERLKAEVESTSQDVAKVEERLEKAKSGESQEKAIRDQLLMSKPGEYIVQLPDITLPQPTPTPSPSLKTAFQEWQELLF